MRHHSAQAVQWRTGFSPGTSGRNAVCGEQLWSRQGELFRTVRAGVKGKGGSKVRARAGQTSRRKATHAPHTQRPQLRQWWRRRLKVKGELQSSQCVAWKSRNTNAKSESHDNILFLHIISVCSLLPPTPRVSYLSVGRPCRLVIPHRLLIRCGALVARDRRLGDRNARGAGMVVVV